jgi:hypothetical protein
MHLDVKIYDVEQCYLVSQPVTPKKKSQNEIKLY